ncbi:helicase [Tanacetum coccineum]
MIMVIASSIPSHVGVPPACHNLGPPSYRCSKCDATMWYAERTDKAKRVAHPTFSLCCQEGKLRLSQFNDTPPPLKTLLDYTVPTTSKFREQIKVYNSMFCFTSFGANIDHSINSGRAPYKFRINGQNYHRMGSLLPAEGVPPRYAQLYFFDTQNEIRNRMSAFMEKETTEKVDENTVARLIQMLDRSNALAQSFRMAKEQYNAPTVSEVAALVVYDFGDGIPSRDIVVNKNNEGPQRISELHPSYMALQYPLLFPYGEDEFHKNIEYYGTTLLQGGRLFQQYLVDAFMAVEEKRLKWMRNNQDTLRVDLYHNLCDAVTRGDTSAAGLEKRIVLPRSFVGSPRCMMQNYQDAMVLSHIPGQKSHDRPEIGTRVFKMKLTELMDDLTKRHVFEDCCAVVYVIEFQKRGLPHAHILLWLEERFKCTTPDEINDIISVELPYPTEDPDGYKVVSEFMLHGPCGKDAKYAPCTTEGKCSKHYPKVFLEETVIDEDGYPIYHRRNNKVTAKKGKFTYNNQHVVPYNRYLLLKYQTHINVEWCNRSKAIKYLFKYLNKGPNRATIVIQENVTTGADGASVQISQVDEIKKLSKLSVWRLFSFDIHYSYPTVMQLNYHLPNQNAVTLRDSEDLPALLEREGINITMFTDWFELNKRDPATRGYTIVNSSLASGERYYLRMLLNVVRGAQSFEKLMTVNKQTYAKVKVACFTYGLLNDDKEWHGRSLAEVQDLSYPNLRLLTNLDNRLIREALDFDVNKSIASLLLLGGRTTYSRFVTPLELAENSTYDIKQNTYLAELMQQVKLIIWDEAPMNQRYTFKALDKTLRDILGYRNSNKRNRIFGGMTVLLGVFTLTRSMRVNEYTGNGDIDTQKQDFNKWVLAVGDERAILIPRNDDADAINEFMFKKLGGASVTYHSADEICKALTDTEDQYHLYPVKFLNTLNFPGMPPHALCLKRELPVMLIRNLNPTMSLCNRGH